VVTRRTLIDIYDYLKKLNAIQNFCMNPYGKGENWGVISLKNAWQMLAQHCCGEVFFTKLSTTFR